MEQFIDFAIQKGLAAQMAKGCSTNNYEEARKQRLEENKKRFEDLGISKISKILTKVTSPAKKSQNHLPKRKLKTNDDVEPRRSSRPRNQVTSYIEEFSTDLPDRRSYMRKRSRSNSSCTSYIARPLDEIKEATDQERDRALDAAEALQVNLQSSKPSFIKSMVRSHVYSCFWLGLPSRFCVEHLPKSAYNINMTLEDEDGSEYDAVYIGSRSGLSGGWRAFALEHKLDDGDALVFELVEPTRFKIYIVRAFPNIDEEEEENDTLVQENMHTSKVTKVSKTSSNRGSKSKKTKKQKLVIETKESESSEESMPEFKPQRVNLSRKTRSSREEVQKKPKLPTTPDSESNEEANTPKKSNSPQKKMQKTSEAPTTPEPKEEAQIEIVKPKTRSQKKMQKISEVSTALESKEEPLVETAKPKAAAKLSNKKQKSKEGNECEIDQSINIEQLLPKDNVETVDANLSKKKEHVQDNDLESTKDKPDEKPNKRASQMFRKKAAPKFFRKRA